MSVKTLKWAAIISFIVAMAILLGGGVAMKKELPPYREKWLAQTAIFFSQNRISLPAKTYISVMV